MKEKNPNKKFNGTLSAENLYHAMFEQAPVGIIVVDPETAEILQFNDKAHQQLGYSREEFSKLRISDIEAINSPQEKQGQLNRMLRENQPEFSTQHRTKNGEIRTVLVNQRKINLSGRKMLLMTCHDVTDAGRIHDALQSSQEIFYGIADSVKDALILVDEEAKVTYWNPAAEKTLGYTSKEAIGKNIHELLIPESICKEGKERIKQSVKIFGETGMGYFTVGNVEVVGRRKDGSEFPAELSISPVKLFGKWNAVGVVKDTTKRKQADRNLRDAEQRYHTLFNQSPLGVLVIDPETASFVEFNDTAHAQLGYSREEFEKTKIFDIEAKETPEQTRVHLKGIMQEGGGEFETQQRRKDGEVRNVIVTAKAYKSADKTFLHCIYHDTTESKKIQNALAESETQYRQLVEVAQEGIWSIDNDFTTVFVNPRMIQMLGYEEREMVGKQLLDFIDVDMAEKFRDYLKGLKEPGMKGLVEYAFLHKDGGRVDTSVALSVITDDGNRKIGILAVVSDITQRKQAEKALKESEERFRAISTSAMDAIILSDEENKVTYWNPAAEKTFGFSEKEVLGKKLTALIVPPASHKKQVQLVEELIKTSTSKRQFGLTALKKDGSSFPIDLTTVSVKLKDKNCVLAIIRDVTEWKAMEETLRQDRDMLENVAASSQACLSIINRDYRIVWANQRSRQISSCKDIENKHCFSVFNKNVHRICKRCGVKKVFEKGVSIDRHDRRIRSGSHDCWIELIATPIKDKDGNVVAALELALDITERKRLQNKLGMYSQQLEETVQKRTEELKKTQAELVKSERLAAIGELAGMIGHDLRNPLTGIKNSVYFIKKKGEDIPPKRTREMLETIDKCVDYSNRIVSDLLDYSGEIHLNIEEESPKKLLNDSLEIVDIPEKITVTNKLKDIPALKVDPDKMKRVFINLIKNAVDAMPNGGEITVTGRKKGGDLQISFTDTGIGIGKEILPKLFSPLFTTKAQGMGFGLAICKRIVEAHGGAITVKTVKGQRTTFTATLPVDSKLKLSECGGEKTWKNIPESSLLTMMKR
jgi:PAS domain S-box-containing protein